MALMTFPLGLTQFFDLLPIGKCTFDPTEALDLAETAGGEVLTADLGTALWSGQIDLALMEHHEAAPLRPLLNLLRRAGASFMVADATRPWPRRDPGGVVLRASTGTPAILAVGGSWRELSLKGLPPWYAISAGDLISFAYGSSPTRFALHECVGDAQAAANGETPLIEVTPPIRPGAAADTAVQLIWPRCKAVLQPGTASLGASVHTITSEGTLRWTQTLR